jgi:hypothetical protein
MHFCGNYSRYRLPHLEFNEFHIFFHNLRQIFHELHAEFHVWNCSWYTLRTHFHDLKFNSKSLVLIVLILALFSLTTYLPYHAVQNDNWFASTQQVTFQAITMTITIASFLFQDYRHASHRQWHQLFGDKVK